MIRIFNVVFVIIVSVCEFTFNKLIKHDLFCNDMLKIKPRLLHRGLMKDIFQILSY